MAVGNQQEKAPLDSPIQALDYACNPWRLSSQCVADLYHSGTKFWTKDNLEDIERQLEQSFHLEFFTVRDLEGNQIRIENPGFQVQRPIWRPCVKYQGYWSLVLSEPKSPAELHKCSYVVGWRNTAADDFRHKIENWQEVFETRNQLWKTSITCKLFKAELSNLLFESQYLHTRKIAKIICFGLGDLVGSPHLEIYEAKKENSIDHISSGPMTQHAMAFTIAEEIRRYNLSIRLIAQDPGYRDCTEKFLVEKGFEIKGQFGAGAFADVDDESLVISAYASAPIRQIIADIAKPAMFITTFWDSGIVADEKSQPFFDADTPRTMDLWKSYERTEFPISRIERELLQFGSDLKVSLFSRK
ncbi:unnamed protein product [Clonostachys rosea]|uniref:SRR1-like domain-containing protein n=1 Tax=Bionectria ochroleuca TaxID=29856 RepID=A0ABY6UY26_BIOOC|nr:unnamed protein product [Clonostachys rosea]